MESLDTINKLYNNLTYLDQYSGSVLMFILLLIIFFIIYSYTQVMVNIQPIKDNWPVERCSPKVIPFAGLINKPDGMTINEFTQQNFAYCMQNILTSITGDAVQPITYLTIVVNELYDELSQVMQYMRNMLANIRADISAITSEIMGRILNIMLPIQNMMIGMTDLMNKVKGILTAGVYTSLGTYFLLQSLLGAIAEAAIIVLIILVAVIMAMWMIPFFWIPAAATTVVFGIVAILISIILVFMADVLNVNIDMTIPSAPSKPTCFDKNTAIKMNDGIYKSIFDIKAGEKLADGNLVTATFKLARTEPMYKLHNIVVSGSHRVKVEDKLIYVSEHPDAIKQSYYFEPYVYCINTESKDIICRNFFTAWPEMRYTVFSDWDELDDDDIIQLLEFTVNRMPDKNKTVVDILEDSTYSIIHRYFDGGFFGDVPIKLLDGTCKNIRDIEIGDKLIGGDSVYGLVEIDGRDIISRPDLINLPAIGKNLHCYTPPTLEKMDGDDGGDTQLYHLLTDTGSFYVNGLKYYHYNASIELFLDKYRENLLSTKYVYTCPN